MYYLTAPGPLLGHAVRCWPVPPLSIKTRPTHPGWWLPRPLAPCCLSFDTSVVLAKGCQSCTKTTSEVDQQLAPFWLSAIYAEKTNKRQIFNEILDGETFVGLNRLQREMGVGNICKSKPSPSGDTDVVIGRTYQTYLDNNLYENKRHQLDLKTSD